MRRKTILWVGDGGVASGFSTLSHSIIQHLPPGYDIHHLAINYHGDPVDTSPAHKLYPAASGGDLYGVQRLKALIVRIRPELVFIVNDPWIAAEYLPRIPGSVPVVVYLTIDAGPLDPEWVRPLARAEAVVSCSEYGRELLVQADPKLDVRVITPGLDRDVFFPVPKEEAARRLGYPIDRDDWLVLNANRNQPRKRIDLTIKGFCAFAKDKPETVKLYLHMGLQDQGWRIDKLMQRFGMSRRLCLTSPGLTIDNCLSREKLNLLYNCCDLGINTSLGEGWGLVPFEHAATGAPQIVPASSALLETFGEGRGLLMPVREETITAIGPMTEGMPPSVVSVAEALEHAYTHPDAMRERADAMLAYTRRPEFDWDRIGETWHELLSGLLGS